MDWKINIMKEINNINTAEILCVGTELLLGDIVNTNAAFLSTKLAALGINVYRHTAVGDNPGRLKRALTAAVSECDLIIMSGGLGPTYDDLTKETVCEFFGRKMYLHEESLESIKEALVADRTLALGFNTVCGAEQLLKDFFVAGVKTQVVSVDSKDRSTVMLTNCTSVPYLIKVGNGNPRYLDPFSTISLRSAAGEKVLKFQVLNMFSAKDAHPVVEVSF